MESDLRSQVCFVIGHNLLALEQVLIQFPAFILAETVRNVLFNDTNLLRMLFGTIWLTSWL